MNFEIYQLLFIVDTYFTDVDAALMHWVTIWGIWVLHLHAAIISFPAEFKFNSGSCESQGVERLPIIQRTCAFRLTSFHSFYSVYPVFIVHLCL